MTRIAWRATNPDGVAHAFTTLPYALCGEARNQHPRFDYQLTSHCPECRAREREVQRAQKAS